MSLTKVSYSLINGADINVRDFGAKGDYYLADGTTVNPTPTDDSAAIIAAYNYGLATNQAISIVGDFYIANTVTFTSRTLGGSGRIILNCDATFHANLDASGDADAVYVGDDTTNGTYPLKMDGMLRITNVGAVKVGKRGLHCQDAAYGYYNVVCDGFDIGIYLQGVIYATFDGKNRGCGFNNLDLRIESFRSTNPVPILRFTNNITEFRNMGFGSVNKVYIATGATASPPQEQTGGLIRFERCLFEATFGGTPPSNTGYTFYAENVGETISSVTGSIELNHCWFEAFDVSLPVIGFKNGRLTLNSCFFAQPNTASTYIELLTDSSFIDFKNTSAYFGDGLPTSGCLVSRGGTATDVYRSNISVQGTTMYGPAGTCPSLHDGMPFGHMRNYATPSGEFYASMTFFYGDGTNEYPTNATDDYMVNATLDIPAFLNELFGPRVESADIYISSGTEAANYAYTNVVYIRDPQGTAASGNAFLQTNSNANLTLVGDVLTWPLTVQAAFFRPLVTVKARISQNILNITV
jgi:hypothetical protein